MYLFYYTREVKDGDVVKEVNEPSYIDSQTRLLWFLVLQYWGMFILRENYIFNRDNLCFTCIQYYWTGPHYGRRGSLMYKIVFREKEREEYTKEILDKPLETFGTDTSELEEKYK